MAASGTALSADSRSGRPDTSANSTESFAYQGYSLRIIGNVKLLNRNNKTGLLCSRQCPAATILEACEKFKLWAADSTATIISGFHSPVEQECLRLLLKGKAGIIYCPPRGIETFRVPKEWRSAIAAGRMLIVSPFTQKRPSRKTINLRNRFVAELADELYIPFALPGGNLEQFIA